jgi:protein CpxP
MKKITLGIVVFVVIVAGGIFALGHKGRKDAQPHMGGFENGGFDRIARDLNLSDEQKAQAKQVFEDSKSRVEPLMKQLRENRQQVKDLGTDGVFDEQKVQEIADAQANLMKQMFIEKEKGKAQLFAILTPEQREQAKQKINDFEGRFKDHGGRGGRGGREKAESGF